MVEQGAFSHVPGFIGGKMTCVDAGVGGNTTTDVLARVEADAFALNPTHVLFDIFLNNIILNEDTAEEITPDLDTLLDLTIAEGAQPIFCTGQPYAEYAGWTTEGEATKQTVNTHIRNYDYPCFEYELVTGDGENPSALLAGFDFGDHLHLSNAGDRACSEAFVNQIFNGRNW